MAQYQNNPMMERWGQNESAHVPSQPMMPRQSEMNNNSSKPPELPPSALMAGMGYGNFTEKLPQFGKNYMQYSTSTSYEDSKYDQYIKTEQNPMQPRNIVAPVTYTDQRPQLPLTQNFASVQQGNYYLCPVCKTLAIRSGEFPERKTMCANGHGWYMKDGARMLSGENSG